MKFEFTTAACLRPELLYETYKTLSESLVDVNLKTEGILYINIDELVDRKGITPQTVINIARMFFSEVNYRIGEKPGNFSKAMAWLFDQPKGRYFLNLEEDWKTIRPNLNIQEHINKMEALEKEHGEGFEMLQCVLAFNKIRLKFHLPPSIIKTSEIRRILWEYPIPDDINPEEWIVKTIRSIMWTRGIKQKSCIMVPEKSYFADTGRRWLRHNLIGERTGTLANANKETLKFKEVSLKQF
jgi:hypothetical protein